MQENLESKNQERHNDNRKIIVVVPIHNEAQNIDGFVQRLALAADLCVGTLTAIFVDDGSSDSSLSLTRALMDKLPGAKLIELSRNFGKEAALLAGMDLAMTTEFDALVLIDADLQHPPEVIPRLIANWLHGNDVVIASRQSREGDSFTRRSLSKMFYKIINHLVDVDVIDGDGDFRLLDRKVVEALCSLRERDRFTKGLYSWVGFRQTRIHVKFEQRRDGVSRFTLMALVSLAGSAITSFSAKPLRVALYAGIVAGIASLFLAFWIGLQTIVFGRGLPGYASIFCGLMFLGGVQLISIGLLGEYMGRTYMEVKGRPPYIVRQVIDGGQK